MMTIWFALSNDHTRGTHKCAINGYDVYNYLIVGDRFSSHATGTSCNINRTEFQLIVILEMLYS